MSSDSEIYELERQLQEAKREIAEAKWRERTCRRCGERDEMAGGERGYLTQLRIGISEGEEGHSLIEGWLCEMCLIRFSGLVDSFGIGIHSHGGNCILEAQTCPKAYNLDAKCPTPELQYPED